MRLVDLPTEMLVCVLQQLPVEDLLKCRRVAKTLNELISSSLLLEYCTLLGSQALVDNAVSRLPSSRKITELRSFAQSWRRLDFSRLYDRRIASLNAWYAQGRKGKPPIIRANDDWDKTYATSIPIHNYAAVYELAGGCFFQDLNGGWPTAAPANEDGAIEQIDLATAALGMMVGMNPHDLQGLFPNGVGGGLPGIGPPPPLQHGLLPPLLEQAQAYAQENANANGVEPHVFVNIDPPEDGHESGGGLGRRRQRSSTLAWLALPSRRDVTFSSDGAAHTNVDPAQLSQAKVTSTYKPQWYTAPFDFRIADICLDFERDLLVVVEREETHELVKTAGGNDKFVWSINIVLHFLSLSESSSSIPTSTPLASRQTNTDDASSSSSSTSSFVSDADTDATVRHYHPDALHPSLECKFPSNYGYPNPNEYAMIVQLAGDFVGVLLSCRHHRQDIDTMLGSGPPRKRDWFCLWDWVKGECLARMDSGREQWDTFCFIGPHALLIPNTTGYGSLNIFFFDDPQMHDPNSTLGADTQPKDLEYKSQFRHVLTLNLPETVHQNAIAHIAMRSEPPPNGRSVGERTVKKPENGTYPSVKPPPLPSSSQAKSRLFYADPVEAVIILTIDYLVPPRRPRNRLPTQLIPLFPPAGHAPPQAPNPPPAPPQPQSGSASSSSGVVNTTAESHEHHAQYDPGQGEGSSAGAGVEAETEAEAPPGADEANEGWGDGPALVVDGFQISLAHPQVVALRRKDVMRWARAAETLHRRKVHEARAARDSKGKGKAPDRSSVSHLDEPLSGLAHAHVHSTVLPSAAGTTTSSSTRTRTYVDLDPLTKRVPHRHAQDWVRRTRWGLGAPPARWVCYTHGTRFASMEDRPFGSSRRVGVRVYDFNPWPIRRTQRGLGAVDDTTDDEEDEDLFERPTADPDWHNAGMADRRLHPYPIKRVIMQERPTRVNLPEIFKTVFSADLPYRMVETEAIFDWDSCMIDDERIIGLKEEENDVGGLEKLEVLVL